MNTEKPKIMILRQKKSHYEEKVVMRVENKLLRSLGIRRHGRGVLEGKSLGHAWSLKWHDGDGGGGGEGEQIDNIICLRRSND